MSTTHTALEMSLGDFEGAWAVASMGAGTSGSVAVDAAGMTDTGVINSLHAIQQHMRTANIARIALAGQIAERSRASLGEAGMARKAGYGRAALMVAAICSITPAEAFRLCEVGLATRTRTAIDGTPLPARYPVVAAAISGGTLGVDSAAVIVKELDAASTRCSVEAREAGEAVLVEMAGQYSVEGTCDELLVGDDRTLEQLRSDAAEQVFHHIASCKGHGGDIPSIMMVIRMTKDSLLTGLGTAEIDGVDESISAGTARRMAGEAGIIPAVLGGPSEVLDFGKTRRLFSTTQKLAFGKRDGGCAFGGCQAPPSYTEAHHIIWWSDVEKTDLDNGILLCGFHHHRIHDGGWEIAFQHGVPYFIPPPRVDPGRTPRRGGKVLLDAAR